MQKGMFWHAKGRLLEGKRRPFLQRAYYQTVTEVMLI